MIDYTQKSSSESKSIHNTHSNIAIYTYSVVK